MRRLFLALLLMGVVVLAGRDTAAVHAQPKAAPVAVPPQFPTLNVPFPLGAPRGQAIELNLTGTNVLVNIADTGVDYIAICGQQGPLGITGAPLERSLWTQLRADLPDWLEPRQLDGAYRVYRVRKDRL